MNGTKAIVKSCVAPFSRENAGNAFPAITDTHMDGMDRYTWSGHSVLLGNRTMEGQETGDVLARFGNGKARSLRRGVALFSEGEPATAPLFFSCGCLT
ncbi:hypothetical protein [Geobacter sp.]|uniref:hypothetical protein n=1 Tax=Geobacter sp. TaxID=46610 RepID=UPI0027B8A3F5|nr:hypothetical protein [Geobacter sp.]